MKTLLLTGLIPLFMFASCRNSSAPCDCVNCDTVECCTKCKQDSLIQSDILILEDTIRNSTDAQLLILLKD